MQSDLHFYMHRIVFKLRDLFYPPQSVLDEAGLRSGFTVVDFGFGTGSYTVPAAARCGSDGRVYAIDVHPLAIRAMKRRIRSGRLDNISVIQTGCATGLPDNAIDAVLLYDVFHALSKPDEVLRELHRVLKPAAIVSFSDYRLGRKEAQQALTKDGLFKLLREGEKTLSFQRI